MSDTVRENHWKRIGHWFARWFSSADRASTPQEAALKREIDDLKFKLGVKEETIEELNLKIRMLKSDVESASHEVLLMGLVHEADRKRWELLIAARADEIAKVEHKK